MGDKPTDPKTLAVSLANSVHKVITETEGVQLLAVQMTRANLDMIIETLGREG